jgi:hypothetical protein
VRPFSFPLTGPLIVAFASFALTGCATGNSYLSQRTSTVEMYHIFDIKNAADTSTVAKAAVAGLAQNTNKLEQVRPLQMGSPVPATLGRFLISDISAEMPTGIISQK